MSSVQTGGGRFVEPLKYFGSVKAANARLLKILGSLENAHIVTSDEQYIHAEFGSPVFKFVDDVVFLIDENTGTIQLKSASRVGSYDFGVNRKRIKMIRDLFEEEKTDDSTI